MEPGTERRVGITYEHVGWAIIGLIALAMRVARLGDTPLAAGEVREAILAWRAATGQGMPTADYSPLLLAANGLLFTLFGASDGLARLLPALCGAGLALTPLLFRRRLGRVGALVSAGYLAISPTALVACRRVDGTVIAAAGAMTFVGGVLRFVETERRGWLTLAAVGLALGVTAEAAVYGVLLPLIVAYGIASQLQLDIRPLAFGHPASRIRRHARHALLTFLAAVVLLATGFGWNLPGVGASGHSLAAWIERFRPASSPAASPLTLLTVYELWAVVFGIGGMIWGWQRRKAVALLLGLWAGLTVLLLALMPGRAPTDVLWAVVPLAMLLGLAMEGLVDETSSDAGLRAVHLLVVVVLWGHAYLQLARYASFGDPADLALALVTVVLQGLVGLSLALVVGWQVSFRTAAAGTAIALLTLTLSAGWGVTYRRSADPREVLLCEPTPSNVRDLVQTLEGISWQQTGLPTTLDFTYEAPQGSVLAWYLRDFDHALRVDRLGDLPADEIGSVVVTVGWDETVMPSTDREYAGQDFPVRRRWTLGNLGCRFWEAGCSSAYDWLLFRDSVSLPEADQWATLWQAHEHSRSE
jgi:uncharacterized protein (TIGR03663 family)